MPNIEFSAHAIDMLAERNILEAWVWRVIEVPIDGWQGDDDNAHYVKPIQERGYRTLHVVVNRKAEPNRVVTVFFDRRLGKRK